MNEKYKRYKEECIRNGYGYLVINMNNTKIGMCVVCGDDVNLVLVSTSMGQYPRRTCSDECHDVLIDTIESIVGKYKKVTRLETGVDYKVPTIDLIEKGIKEEDLDKYPIWNEKEIDEKIIDWGKEG